MMKTEKKATEKRPLQLQRETLRTLRDTAMNQAVGGMRTQTLGPETMTCTPCTNG